MVVLKTLAEGPKSGYALMKEIHDFTGQKPSAGSMYPLLEQLHDKKLVSVKQKGRSKEYSLTAKGKKVVEDMHELHDKCFEDFLKRMKMVSALTGEDLQMPIAVISKMKCGQDPFKDINPELHKVRVELFRLAGTDKLKKNSGKIKKALAKTLKELKVI